MPHDLPTSLTMRSVMRSTWASAGKSRRTLSTTAWPEVSTWRVSWVRQAGEQTEQTIRQAGRSFDAASHKRSRPDQSNRPVNWVSDATMHPPPSGVFSTLTLLSAMTAGTCPLT